MRALISRIFSTKAYKTRVAIDLALHGYQVTVLLIVLFTAFAALVPLGDGQLFISEFGQSPLVTVGIPLFYLVGFGSLILIRIGRYEQARWGIPTLMLAIFLVNIEFGAYGADSATLLMAFIVLGAIFVRERGVMITTLISILITIALAFYQNVFNAGDSELSVATAASLVVQFLGVGLFLGLFLRTIHLEGLEATSTVTEERLKLAELITEIAGSVLRRTDLSQIFTGAVEEIRERYPRAYHVQIFLLDEARRNARLAASTGEVGQMLMSRGHSLPVGSTSVIGQVTAKGEIVVARAGSGQTVHKRNEFLPDTIVEAAFPLRIGDIVIGALDMQSKLPEAFPSSELPIFQALADDIAIAIDNARLIEQTQDRVRENARLAEQANQALQEVERLNRQLTSQSWQDYIERQNDEGITVDIASDNTRYSAEITPTLTEAVRFNHIVQRQRADGLVISAPVAVRGTAIGAMEFELEGTEPLEADTLDLINAVCERLGLAVESARLYEESRRSARREATINDIAGRLQSTNSINTILTEAARGIQESLGVNRVAIRLGVPPADTNGGKKE